MKRAQLLPFLILALIGILLTRNYGESWDELKLYKYADNSLTAYATWMRTGEIPIMGAFFENYGPAFMMFSTLITRALIRLGLSWLEVDIHHLIYFLTFLLGVWSLYEICKRWMSATAAAGATLLFATQPLLWGHAFINPKDTTLLAMMLLSVHLGLKMHDSLFGPQPFGSTQDKPDSAFDALASAWANLPKPTQRLLITTASLWLLAILILFGGTPLWRSWFDSSVRAATNNEAILLGPLILRVASNIHEVPPEVYTQKFFVAFLQARAGFFWSSTIALLWLIWRKLPAAFRLLKIILPASIFLGFTGSIRIFGPLAGVLVTQHALRHTGKKSILVIMIYALLSIIVMYATWPYLWLDPVGHLAETVTIMSRHFWKGLVLFNGIEYAATDLPSSYMPVLLAIQLTEPVWTLCVAGLTVTVVGFVKRREGSRDLLILTMIWLIIPLATFIILRPTMFDNFRHSFFILPMIFVLAGIALDQIRQPLLRALVILALAVPGILSIVRLHPYEYTYYNSFTGGMRGAFRKFEMDYWGTSYREIALHLNQSAPPNSTVWLEGPTHIFETYARADIGIYSTYEVERADRYDYVVMLSRHQDDLLVYPDAPVIFSVTRAGAVLAVIKKP